MSGRFSSEKVQWARRLLYECGRGTNPFHCFDNPMAIRAFLQCDVFIGMVFDTVQDLMRRASIADPYALSEMQNAVGSYLREAELIRLEPDLSKYMVGGYKLEVSGDLEKAINPHEIGRTLTDSQIQDMKNTRIPFKGEEEVKEDDSKTCSKSDLLAVKKAICNVLKGA